MQTLNGYEIWPDADDECIAREDDNYDGPYGGGRCTCGFLEAAHAWAPEDGNPRDHFAGCAGCDPVMWDCKPYGWGIDLWEDEGRCAAARGTAGCFLPGLLRECDRLAYMDASTTASRRRERASDLRWNRILDTAETHTQAVDRYTSWAKQTVKRRYRDDH